MEYFEKFVRRLGTVCGAIGTIFLVAIMAVIMTNIVLRAFGRALIGTYEAVQLMSVVTASFCIGYCAIKQGHVVVSLVTTRLPERIRTLFYMVTSSIAIGLWALIIWKGAVFAWQHLLKGEVTHVMRWPIYPMRFVFVLGSIILCLVLLVDLFRAFRRYRENDPN